MAFLLRSLRRREYRLYFIGQSISLHGTWMQNVAQAWLVYRLTESSFLLGLVAFCALIPVLLFSFLGGWLADHLPRRRLFLATQILALIQALLLAVLTLSGQVQVWQIIVLAFGLGVVHAVEIPARHSMMAGLVPREELHNAIALNAGLFNLARFLGPALAGILILQLNEGWVFLLNGLSFIPTLIALWLIGLESNGMPRKAAQKGALQEGLRYVLREPALRNAIVLVSAVSLFASPYTVLMPVVVREVFHSGPDTLGFLLGAAGCGALLAALRLAALQYGQSMQDWITLGSLLAGASLLVFSRVTQVSLALPLLAIAGFATTTVFASTNTYLQLSVPDELRGRVMSLFSSLFIGIAPIGNLLAGSVAEAMGVQWTLFWLGVGCLLVGVLYRWRGYQASET